ncbi:putative MATE family efflux protein [Enterococcus sp. PF1-24]|uniref:MATE family efflux transporter n=1 Tax=unclassified Enterococcus TaxID=2608891 RepID=UPI002476F789|nr:MULTISPECIES: MATE family efflux transporter [unclassified Enterococcus]MDH6363403.1 putative MATE family efflux protein [Enterococcus sp. PFB1-1]MDH6400497.1 putative MATE family efflux protein [Enterococcus sp. PF1-24]
MRDLTTGSPIKLIFLFTIPLLIGNIFQQFYNMVDMIIVGQTLGKNALAAVGATGSITFLILGFAQGLTSGLSILTAQRFGAQDYKGVKRSFATSIIICMGVTVVLTALSLLLVGPMLTLMQTPAEIFDLAKSFISVILAGIFASVSYNLLSNMIRALGDSRTPLLFLTIAVIVNVGLDLTFIVIFHLGVAGAAYATILAQLASSIACIIFIKFKVPNLQLRKSDFVIDKKEIRDHLNIALPMAFQTSIIAIGAVILQSALNSLGTDEVAAQAAAGRIDQFATQPMMSFGVAMGTFTAQNYGAKKYGRILTGVKQSLLLSCGFSIIAGVTVITFGHNLVQLFVNQSETRVFQLAQIYFNINGSMYWILAILFIIRYTLQGLGQSVIPTIAGIMELIMRSLAAIFLTGIFGYAGAASASPLAWIGSVVVLLYSYFKAVKQLQGLEKEQELLRE